MGATILPEALGTDPVRWEAGASLTRQQLLTALRRSGPNTLAGLSQLLGISREGVRKHLVILEREGLVSVSLRRGAPGRPGHTYTLTERANESFPKRYADLALEVLDYLQERYGAVAVDEFFAARTERWLELYRPPASSDLRARLQALTTALKQAEALAEWEETGDGFVLRCHNCRISRVSRRYPQACTREQELIQRVLRAGIRRLACMAEGDAACRYLVT